MSLWACPFFLILIAVSPKYTETYKVYLTVEMAT